MLPIDLKVKGKVCKKSKEVKRVLITGITGQDGIYMTGYLLFQEPQFNYHIFGIIRKNSAGLDYLRSIERQLQQTNSSSSLTLYHGDVQDFCCVKQLLDKLSPLDYIYNFAA